MAQSSADPHGVGVVTLVEAGVFRTAAGRARVTFLALTTAGAVLGAIVGSLWVSPAWGFLLGGVAGFVLGLLAGGVVALWPLLRVLWHWAAEIATVLLLSTVSTLLASWGDGWLPLTVLTAITAIVLVVPVVRHRARAWMWCGIVRHRLRLSFAAFIRSRNRIHVRGAAPLILWARPTPAGERVWVWLRAGLDLAELESNVDKLAVACWAADVRVSAASEHQAALVRVDVSRRDPLTATVASHLVDLVPPTGAETAAGVVGPVGGLDLDQVPAELVAADAAPRVRGGAR